MAYIREYSPGGGCMGFPSIKSSYAYIWWLGLLRVVQALKVIILPLPLSAGVMCCPPLIFKPSLGKREKLPQKVGTREQLAEKVGRGRFTVLYLPLHNRYYTVTEGSAFLRVSCNIQSVLLIMTNSMTCIIAHLIIINIHAAGRSN